MTLAALVLLTLVGFMIHVVIRYSPIVARIFEEKPMFLPLRVSRPDEGEDVRFPSENGLTLAGTYLKTRTAQRSGVIIFCHEYLSNRWSVVPYLDHLRDHGFDLFSFDYRNHGESDKDTHYNPLQWVTQHEVNDLNAAIDYLRTRDDYDPRRFRPLWRESRCRHCSLCRLTRPRGCGG